jgi:hypothetical protein
VTVLALYSFWIPQIIYSAITGTKSSLHPVYVLLTSLSRLFIPLYLLGCPRNFLMLLLSDLMWPVDISNDQQKRWTACCVLVGWLGIQTAILLIQGVYGSRFFVPKRFLPSKYDYKRAVPRHLVSNLVCDSYASDEGVEMKVNMNINDPSEEHDLERGPLLEHGSGIECVICYAPIAIERNNYMVCFLLIFVFLFLFLIFLIVFLW